MTSVEYDPLTTLYLKQVLGIHQIVRPRTWELSNELVIKGTLLSDLIVVNFTRYRRDLCYGGPASDELTESGALLNRILLAIRRDWQSIYFIEKRMVDEGDVNTVQSQLADAPGFAVLIFGSALFSEATHTLFSWKNKKCLVTHSLADMLSTPSLKAQTWKDLQRLQEELK